MRDCNSLLLRAIIKTTDKDGLAKTHNGLISAFGLHLVKPGLVSKELGRALNRGEEVRIVADYLDMAVSQQDASTLVEQAHWFVVAMRELVESEIGLRT